MSHGTTTLITQTHIALQFWTNVFPTKLVEKHQREIKRFNWTLKVMRWFEVFFALIPIKISLKMFFFSDE